MPTKPLIMFDLDPDVPVYPCHTDSSTGVSGCPDASSTCTSPYGFGVYTYSPATGKFTLVNADSSCSNPNQCHSEIQVTGAEKRWLDTIASFDPNRRYFCCCDSALGSGASIRVTVPAGTTLEKLLKLQGKTESGCYSGGPEAGCHDGQDQAAEGSREKS